MLMVAESPLWIPLFITAPFVGSINDTFKVQPLQSVFRPVTVREASVTAVVTSQSAAPPRTSYVIDIQVSPDNQRSCRLMTSCIHWSLDTGRGPIFVTGE